MSKKAKETEIEIAETPAETTTVTLDDKIAVMKSKARTQGIDLVETFDGQVITVYQDGTYKLDKAEK